jgi:uncharacterized integral membrane protein (TIGR00698 family)
MKTGTSQYHFVGGQYWSKNLPGILLCGFLAAAAFFLDSIIGGPVMVYALALGVMCHHAVLNFDHGVVCKAGVDFTANVVLKVAVACLGVRITTLDIASLGWPVVTLTLACVGGTLVLGMLIGKALGLKTAPAVLSSGAVGICGTSAALAISAVLPRSKETECHTLMTVIGITLLSTLAMIVYPVLSDVLGLTDRESGILFGATIHNVAQAVGAGHIISQEAADTATIVKLIRVAMLVPVIFFLGLFLRANNHDTNQKTEAGGQALPLLPTFLLAFIAIVLVNSVYGLPESVSNAVSTLSHMALVAVVAALGIKTSVKDIFKLGLPFMWALALQTCLIVVLAIIGISILS